MRRIEQIDGILKFEILPVNSKGEKDMIQVAILGCGTVGSGVYEVLSMNHDSIAGKAEDTLEVKYILDRKDFSGTPLAGKVVRDFSIIEERPGRRHRVRDHGRRRPRL